MNANELADALDDVVANYIQMIADVDFSDVATMLRQQQAEIEALKANRKHDFGLGEASGFIKGHKENPYQSITNTKIEPTVVSYTHPVKEQDESFDRTASHMVGEYVSYKKELTDEEITACIDESEPDTADMIRFARAILRKAQDERK